jgi:UDP-N-acetylglucosamine--N-acetylmuramyl-(pentapeptide) pyrophosphoryl-undecaprenol N-acetylglucosamine transferase
MTAYAQFEYVSEDLPHLFALADVVISRAGATTLFELLALRKPALLIPLPLKSSRGDQIANARSFERQNFSDVLPEEELTPEALTTAVRNTYARRDQLMQAMQKASIADGVERVLDVIRHYTHS